jgi:hypothetical protein
MGITTLLVIPIFYIESYIFIQKIDLKYKKVICLQYETQNFVQNFNVQNILFTGYLRTFMKNFNFEYSN